MLLGGLSVRSVLALRSDRSALAAQKKANAKMEAELADLDHLRRLQADLDGGRRRVQAALAGDVSWTRFLDGLVRSMPESVWLQSLTAQAESGARPAAGAAAPAAAANGGSLQIAAIGLDYPAVADWLDKVAADPAVGNLAVGGLTQDRPGQPDRRQFHVDGQRSLPPLAPTGRPGWPRRHCEPPPPSRPQNDRGAPRAGGRSSSRAVIALAVMGAVVALYGWNAVFLGPRNKARTAVQTELSAARQQEQDLRANMAQLRKLAADTKSREAELAGLGRLVPADADMDGAILALDDAAKQAQVNMTTLVPSLPAAVAGGPATVGLAMTIDGTFDQIFDYLRRLETLDRLVVIDSLQLAGGGNGAGAAPAGPLKLSAQIKARLFAAGGPAPAVTAAAGATDNSDPSKTAALPKAGG